MSHVEFFPYPTAAGSLVLTCESDDPSALIEDRRVQLQALAEDQEVELSLTVTAAEGSLETALPASELDAPPVRIMVVLRGVPARTRQSIALEAEGERTWTGKVSFSKADLYRTLALEPVAIRATKGTDTGYAQHVGARLGWGLSVAIEIDDPPIPTGGYLDIQWDDFKHSDKPLRKSNSDLMYMLDTEGETPKLWLNSGIDQLKPVMHVSGPRGRSLRVRDAVFDTIVSQVWSSLVSAILVKLASELGEEEDSDAVLEMLNDWELRILHHWAQHLFPESGDRGDAIGEVLYYAAAPELRGALQDRLGMAVQRHARTVYAFKGLIRLRDGEGV